MCAHSIRYDWKQTSITKPHNCPNLLFPFLLFQLLPKIPMYVKGHKFDGDRV